MVIRYSSKADDLKFVSFCKEKKESRVSMFVHCLSLNQKLKTNKKKQKNPTLNIVDFLVNLNICYRCIRCFFGRFTMFHLRFTFYSPRKLYSILFLFVLQMKQLVSSQFDKYHDFFFSNLKSSYKYLSFAVKMSRLYFMIDRLSGSNA